MRSLKDQFVDWVGQQDPAATYDYEDPGNCAFSRFLRDAGYARNPSCDDRTWSDGANGVQHRMPAGLEPALNPPVWDAEFTFGALASRLSISGIR